MVAQGSISKVQMPTIILVHVNHGEKPEKFIRLNFKRWKEKILFYLTTLNLVKFLSGEAPKLNEGETDM